MLAVLSIVLGVGLIAALFIAALLLRRALPAPSIVARTVVVRTSDGQTIRGVLTGDYSDRIELSDAREWVSADEAMTIGGTCIVFRSKVAYLQLIPAGE